MSFGIQKLWDVLSQECELFQGFEVQVTKLKRGLNLLKSFVEDADAKKHTSAVIKTCVEEIKEIICDGEDTIETFILMEKIGKESGIKKRIRRLACSIPNRRKNALDIGGLCTRISKVIEDMQSFGVQQTITNGGYTQPLQKRQRDMRQAFPKDFESDFVGLEANVKKLVGYFVEEDNVQVVSITGMGGLGKTTLARQVFNHEDVKRQFDGLAWVCVTQDFTRKNVWQKILGNLKPREAEKKILEMTEEKLQGELIQLLEISKSLIVLDDIWKEDDWDLIKPIFPPEKGWKVLLTSRNENVAVPRNTATYVNLKPECLTNEDSWTLFQRIAQAINDAFNFKIDGEMEGMAKEMIKHCEGLPLAIKVLGGLLAEKYTLHDWKRLSGNIASHILERPNSNNNSIYHVLSLSYEELPSYLKQCFLYMAYFPEDYEVDIEKLCYYWAVEGIIEPRHYDGDIVRDVGDSCIEELVRRNMIIAERSDRTLRFETCHLHDMMREICLFKAKEENLVQITNNRSQTANFKSHGTSRKLVFQFPTTLHVEKDIKNQKLQSLVVVCNKDLWRESWKLSGSSYKRLELLRVLDLYKAKFEEGKLPSSIGKLIHLRYLSLEEAKVSHLPSSLENLKLLIYPNLNTWESILFVPNVLMGMQELKYLALPRRMDKKTKLELRNLEKLETLMNFSTENGSIKDLRGMARLRFLSIYVDDERSLETVSASISGLKHLEFLSIEDRSERRIEEGIVLDFIHLKHLQLDIKLPRQQRFPSRLTMIQLWNCGLEEDPMPILEKLHQLKVVRLYGGSFSGRRMVCSGGGFPQLQKLSIGGLKEWEEWIVEEGSMPLLHTLEISYCPYLKELPDRLQFISSLKELKINKEWKERLSEGGADFYKVKHIPSIEFI